MFLHTQKLEDSIQAVYLSLPVSLVYVRLPVAKTIGPMDTKANYWPRPLIRQHFPVTSDRRNLVAVEVRIYVGIMNSQRSPTSRLSSLPDHTHDPSVVPASVGT